MGLLNWLKKLLKRQKPKQEFQLKIPRIEVTLEAKNKKEALTEANKAIGVLLKHEEYWKEVQHPTLLVPKAGRQATRQDMSKFMKHGKLNKEYRVSIKRKKQPDDN